MKVRQKKEIKKSLTTENTYNKTHKIKPIHLDFTNQSEQTNCCCCRSSINELIPNPFGINNDIDEFLQFRQNKSNEPTASNITQLTTTNDSCKLEFNNENISNNNNRNFRLLSTYNSKTNSTKSTNASNTTITIDSLSSQQQTEPPSLAPSTHKQLNQDSFSYNANTTKSISGTQVESDISMMPFRVWQNNELLRNVDLFVNSSENKQREKDQLHNASSIPSSNSIDFYSPKKKGSDELVKVTTSSCSLLKSILNTLKDKYELPNKIENDGNYKELEPKKDKIETLFKPPTLEPPPQVKIIEKKRLESVAIQTQEIKKKDEKIQFNQNELLNNMNNIYKKPKSIRDRFILKNQFNFPVVGPQSSNSSLDSCTEYVPFINFSPVQSNESLNAYSIDPLPFEKIKQNMFDNEITKFEDKRLPKTHTNNCCFVKSTHKNHHLKPNIFSNETQNAPIKKIPYQIDFPRVVTSSTCYKNRNYMENDEFFERKEVKLETINYKNMLFEDKEDEICINKRLGLLRKPDKNDKITLMNTISQENQLKVWPIASEEKIFFSKNRELKDEEELRNFICKKNTFHNQIPAKKVYSNLYNKQLTRTKDDNQQTLKDLEVKVNKILKSIEELILKKPVVDKNKHNKITETNSLRNNTTKKVQKITKSTQTQDIELSNLSKQSVKYCKPIAELKPININKNFKFISNPYFDHVLSFNKSEQTSTKNTNFNQFVSTENTTSTLFSSKACSTCSTSHSLNSSLSASQKNFIEKKLIKIKDKNEDTSSMCRQTIHLLQKNFKNKNKFDKFSKQLSTSDQETMLNLSSNSSSSTINSNLQSNEKYILPCQLSSSDAPLFRFKQQTLRNQYCEGRQGSTSN